MALDASPLARRRERIGSRDPRFGIRVKHILIVAPNWLGDAVMALPAIADVRRAAPGAAISIAARPSVAPLFGLVPGVAERGIFDTPFDAALLLPNSFQSALTVFRARIPERWGYGTDWRGPLLTRTVARPPPH